MYAVASTWDIEQGVRTSEITRLIKTSDGWRYPETEIIFPSDGVFYHDEDGLHYFNEDITHFYNKFVFLVCKTQKTAQFIQSAIYLGRLMESWDIEETSLIN